MATIHFDLTGNAEAELARIMKVVENRKAILSIIGRVITTRIELGFKTATSPWGEPWAPLKSRQGTPLIDTRRLLSSISYQVSGDEVSIGTNVEYGPYQHFGFTAKKEASTKDLYFYRDRNGNVGNRFVKKNKSNFVQQAIVEAHEVVVPARPFLPITHDEVIMPQTWTDATLRQIQQYYEGKL